MLESDDRKFDVGPKQGSSISGPADSVSSKEHEGNLSWRTVGMIEIGEIVGVGVLTMGLAFSELGYVLAVILIAILGPVNIYMGILLSRCYQAYPGANSYAILSDMTLYKWASGFVRAMTYIYFIFIASSYFLALTQTLEIAFWGVKLCQPIWGVIAFCALIIPVQIRSFSGAMIVFWINFGLIVVAIFLVLIYLWINIKDSPGKETVSAGPPSYMGWIEFFNALSKITFAYLGCFVFLEMMSEMGKPKDFPKTFYVSAPVQIGLYLLVGIVSYTYSGEDASDSIIKQVDPNTYGGLLSAAAACLVFHLMVSYFIMALAFQRNMHDLISPSTVNDYGWKGRSIWFGLSLITLIFAYVISNGVYFFDSLVSLLGSLFGPILGFHCPILFHYFAKKKLGESIGIVETIILWAILVYATALLTAGTAANIITLEADFADTGSVPFSCDRTSYLESWS
eukprot:CAMPEP_0171488380 /NCGR_PEP_ID=MMETSP0958-20121227/2171_1 /TAXON_ID=87120 /ORGANISM="Aurantiochytrium limacinum, Strain ATCCMYA-1381" /LENGTH=453 /DNA_ID=CAMNT_0012021479 /DNA_START=90 /DNA_END=1451 /DNA_ORIENTATION=+